jgi:hypothetical protein
MVLSLVYQRRTTPVSGSLARLAEGKVNCRPRSRSALGYLRAKANGSGAERLILSGGGNVLIDSEVGQEGLHLGSAHLLGMALVVVEDEAPDPVDVGLPGARGIVHETDGVFNTFEQLLGTGFCAHFCA